MTRLKKRSTTYINLDGIGINNIGSYIGYAVQWVKMKTGSIGIRKNEKKLRIQRTKNIYTEQSYAKAVLYTH